MLTFFSKKVGVPTGFYFIMDNIFFNCRDRRPRLSTMSMSSKLKNGLGSPSPFCVQSRVGCVGCVSLRYFSFELLSPKRK